MVLTEVSIEMTTLTVFWPGKAAWMCSWGLRSLGPRSQQYCSAQKRTKTAELDVMCTAVQLTCEVFFAVCMLVTIMECCFTQLIATWPSLMTSEPGMVVPTSVSTSRLRGSETMGRCATWSALVMSQQAAVARAPSTFTRSTLRLFRVFHCDGPERWQDPGYFLKNWKRLHSSKLSKNGWKWGVNDVFPQSKTLQSASSSAKKLP